MHTKQVQGIAETSVLGDCGDIRSAIEQLQIPESDSFNGWFVAVDGTCVLPHRCFTTSVLFYPVAMCTKQKHTYRLYSGPASQPDHHEMPMSNQTTTQRCVARPLPLGELARVVALEGCDRGLHQHVPLRVHWQSVPVVGGVTVLVDTAI